MTQLRRGRRAAPLRALDGAVLAVTFLTVLPLRVGRANEGGDAAPAFFPLVGAAIGAAAGGVFAVGEPALGAAVAAVLALVTLVVLTGGLHQDGLADCADGMGVRGDRERRLQVMRDPANGTFGTLALVLWALLAVAVLAQLDRGDAVVALVAAAALGRAAALVHGRWAPAARGEGLGADFRPAVGAVVVGCVSAVLLAGVSGLAPAAGSVLAAAAVAALITAWSVVALGGRTGDTLGACVVVAEVAVLLVQVAFAGG